MSSDAEPQTGVIVAMLVMYILGGASWYGLTQVAGTTPADPLLVARGFALVGSMSAFGVIVGFVVPSVLSEAFGESDEYEAQEVDFSHE